jgi:cellulose synthase/poly-beta-1,6-N-acetylglucosamine synthase-like glycosyltransferase
VTVAMSLHLNPAAGPVFEVLFWICAAAILWTYAGYPLLVAALAAVRGRTYRFAPIEPTVTVIIAAYNEEKHIGEKLDNMLALDYPREKLEIIVASDCSTDRTHEIVESYRDRGVKLVALPQRGGKTAGQNAAAREATGEILVFTDATTEFPPSAVRELVQGFADERVGCIDAPHQSVSSEGTVVGKGGSTYRGYETRIKAWEARVNSLIGVTGCLYAVRRSIYDPIDPDLISDFIIASKVYAKGYVTVSNERIVTRETALENPGKEFDMRVRIVIRSINGMVREAKMLNPLRYGFFSFQLWSHKVLRYLVPELLLGTFLTGGILALSDAPRARLYAALFGLQLAITAAAFLGWLAARFRLRVPLLHIPFYFFLANIAALWGFLLYLKGERKVTWTTVR